MVVKRELANNYKNSLTNTLYNPNLTSEMSMKGEPER